MASLREEGAEEERIRWGEANLRKAKAKVAEKQEAIEGFDQAVRRGERELAAVVARVKDEEVDEVVEVDVHGKMKGASVKEEEEETKVVEVAPAGGGGMSDWLRGLMGSRAAGGSRACHGTRQSWLAPTPQTWTPPSSSPQRVRYGLSGFCWCGCTTGCWGRGGGYGWTGGGALSTWTSPCAWGWSRGRGGGNVGCRGRGISDGGRCPPPPPERGVKMFELAQTNIFTPERKKGGWHPLAIHRPLLVGAGLGGG